jgi:hypothetical protein
LTVEFKYKSGTILIIDKHKIGDGYFYFKIKNAYFGFYKPHNYDYSNVKYQQKMSCSVCRSKRVGLITYNPLEVAKKKSVGLRLVRNENYFRVKKHERAHL